MILVSKAAMSPRYCSYLLKILGKAVQLREEGFPLRIHKSATSPV
jgi:hypothetical protein